MAISQDPMKQISYLQQCLSTDKKPLGLFLGAGCPASLLTDGDLSPLIPAVGGITRAIRTILANCKDCGPLLSILDKHFSDSELATIDIEQMLSHIRTLRAAAGDDEARGLSAADCNTLDDRICKIIQELVDKQLPEIRTPYHSIASWIGSTGRDKPVEIFTTNYDLLMEQAMEINHVPYFDGFAGSHKPFFNIRAMEDDSLPARWARIWKLHGSVNWYQLEGKGVFRGTTKEDHLRRVIHPSNQKLEESRRMPFLAMIDQLRSFLKQPTAVLLVCGFSFRDEHVNEVFMQGLQRSPTSVVFGLLYDDLSRYPEAIDLASQCRNLSLLARDSAVIGSVEYQWLERSEESDSASNGKDWIRNEEDESGKLVKRFALGDFKLFGEFIQELMGYRTEPGG